MATKKTGKQRPKGGTKNDTVLSVRIPAKLAMVMQRAAEIHGRSVADQHRLIIEFSSHLAMLAEVRDPEVQERLRADGRDPAEYEAALVAETHAAFLDLYGKPMPTDAYTVLN